jgi:hypothetical protein
VNTVKAAAMAKAACAVVKVKAVAWVSTAAVEMAIMLAKTVVKRQQEGCDGQFNGSNGGYYSRDSDEITVTAMR